MSTLLFDREYHVQRWSFDVSKTTILTRMTNTLGPGHARVSITDTPWQQHRRCFGSVYMTEGLYKVLVRDLISCFPLVFHFPSTFFTKIPSLPFNKPVALDIALQQ